MYASLVSAWRLFTWAIFFTFCHILVWLVLLSKEFIWNCVANEISWADVLNMLQKAFGKSALSKTRACEWYKDFKNSHTVVEDLSCSRRPSMSNTDENVKKVISVELKNRHTTSSELGIIYRITQHILVEILGMCRVALRLFPKDLNFLQKQNWKTIAEDIISELNNDLTFIAKLLIETWMHGFDMKANQQSSEWCFKDKPKPKKQNATRELKAIPSVAYSGWKTDTRVLLQVDIILKELK